MTDLQGYSDWKRTNQQVGDLLVNVAAGHAHAGVSYGPYNVGPWSALLISLTPATPTPILSISVAWFADAAMTVPMGSVSYASRVGAVVIDELVNLGPWVHVTVLTASVAPDDVFALQIVPLSTLSPIARLIPGSAVVFVSNVNLAAAAISQTTASFVTSGPATLFVGGDQHCVAILRAIDAFGGNALFATVDAPLIAAGIAGNQAPIILPTSCVELDVVNLGAVAGHFFASVIPLP